MSTDRASCDRMSTCVRRAGHSGACTACPSSATLDWDEHRVADGVLRDLDFPTPWYADLRDDEGV